MHPGFREHITSDIVREIFFVGANDFERILKWKDFYMFLSFMSGSDML